MAFELLSALALYAFVSSITPGPNNMMLMASGANFGLLRTLPHMMGVAGGFVIMAWILGAALVPVFDAYPRIYDLLKILAVGYLLWLAWKIATAVPRRPEATPGGRPLTFLQAAAFQWVNPKAVSMAVTAVTLYTPDDPTLAHVTIAVLTFGPINLVSVSSWAILGREMRRVLSTPDRLRAFNWTMAGLLVLSLVPILAM